jgi:uncharacterized protein (DUF58 family)
VKRLFIRAPVRLFAFARSNLNLLIVLAALGTCIGLAAVSGEAAFYRIAYVLGGLVPLSFIWGRLNLRGLKVEAERPEQRLQVGQEAETIVTLRNQSPLTKVWLEVEDRTDMPGDPPRVVLTLPANGRRNWRIRTPCRRRGIFSAGPVRVTTGDPFGLFRFSRDFGEPQPLLVLPRAESLPYFWAPAAQLPGEGAVRRTTHYVTPNAASVREYHPGDSYNRIHWRSTARLGRMMVKTFEMDPSSNVWLVLDLHRDVQAGAGDESTEEYGVRIVTSLAYHFANMNRTVGLIARGGEGVLLEPLRGAPQYGRILEAMATARATGDTPLGHVLSEESRRLGRHTTVIIVTPDGSQEWVLALQTLLQQGARAAAVLLDRESFGGDAPDEATGALAASGVLTYTVRAGSDISLMLGPAGVSGDALSERPAAAAR